MSLAGALKAKGNAQEAFAAVLTLGQMHHDKAVDLLIGALARRDGVARSAARELGKVRAERAIPALVAMLGEPEINQAAADALLAFGPLAVGALMEVLKDGNGLAREAAALTLGELRDKRAVEPLLLVMQTDDVYAVRTAAATALGNLKDARAIWVLVQTLQLRDETSPERQQALEQLRQAAQLAMRRIGDPLAAKAKPTTVGAAADAVEQAAQFVAQVEQRLTETGIHPRLVTDAKLLNQHELIDVMQELINASEEISWASLERREPMVPAYFKTYEQRVAAAELVGKELLRRGGPGLLKQVHQQLLGGNAALGNWWRNLE